VVCCGQIFPSPLYLPLHMRDICPKLTGARLVIISQKIK
jgi:hypothetical protein